MVRSKIKVSETNLDSKIISDNFIFSSAKKSDSITEGIEVFAKVLLIGDSDVGKTALMENLHRGRRSSSSRGTDLSEGQTRRGSESRYIDQPVISTIGVDFKIISALPSQLAILKTRHPELKSISNIKYRIWDASGSERFRPIITNYYRNLDALVVVCDLSDLRSFQNVETWLNDFNEKADQNSNDITTIIVGNKSDLYWKQQISPDELGKLAKRLGLPYLITSAKDYSPEHIIDYLNFNLLGTWQPQIRNQLQIRHDLAIQQSKVQCCAIS